MALFRGGPRSNITQVVSPMYQGIIQAEKQKGQAVREAMGAFGKAIDPKTIGMRKFKEEFANADWTNPETYFSASKFLSEFDPTAAIDMSNRGMQLRAATAPKRDMQIVEEYDPATGQMVQTVVNLATVAEGTTFGAAKAPESKIGDIKVADFTPESVESFATSGKYSDLVPVEGTDTVFGKVTPKDYTTESIKAFQAGGATDYSLLVPRNPDPDPDVYSIEKVVMNGQEFTVAINRTNPTDRVIIGTGKDISTDKPSTLSTQVSEAFGFDAGTPEHQEEMQKLLARKGTVKTLPSAAQQIGEIRKQVTSNPTYKAAMERRIKVETAQKLVPEVKAGNESAVPLLERTVSEIYNADTRAASEIDRLVKRKSWSTAFQDWLAGGFQGTLSNATIEDLDKMIEIMDQATAKSVNDIVDLENLLYKDIEGLDNAIVARTLDRFRIVTEGEGADFRDITQGRVRAANQPTQPLEDGIYSDGSGGRLEVINGVAYEL